MAVDENKKEKGALEDINERLYQRGFEAPDITPGTFKKKERAIAGEWEKETAQHKPIARKSFLNPSMIRKILIGSAIFFAVAIIFAAVRFYFGSSFISLENIDISIQGPVSIAGGEEFTLEVDIENKSDVALQDVSMFVEYPQGAYAAVDSEDELSRTREDLDDIVPSAIMRRVFPMVLFGEENSEKEIAVTLEFRFEGSSAVLEKTETYPIRVSSSPVNLSISVPEEVNSLQEFEMVISLESNTRSTLSNLLLQVDYPFGFTLQSATPSPLVDNGTWNIGDLSASDSREVRIRGTIEGQESDERVFRVYVGTRQSGAKDIIGTIYNFTSEPITITRPFLGIDLLVGAVSAPEYAVQSDKRVRVDIPWKSNIPNRVTDAEIIVKLSGPVDKFSIATPAGGFYRSIDNTIIWNKTTGRVFDVIEPGDRGSVRFEFMPLPLIDSDGNISKDPQIKIEVSVQGRRVSEANVPEITSTSISKNVKIESDVALASRAVYYTGPFKNSGPLPPRPEQETTYTVIWTVTNTANNISGATVRTTLPTYVRWIGAVSPSGEDVVFNEVGGEVVWDTGSVARGAGFTSGAREVAFQVALLPSVSQMGRAPFLTSEVILDGKDTFTGTTIQSTTKGLSTQLSTDPYFSKGQAVVTF